MALCRIVSFAYPCDPEDYHFYVDMEKAMKMKCLYTVKSLLSSYDYNIVEVLAIACDCHYFIAIDYILETYPDISINSKDYTGNTLMHRFCMNLRCLWILKSYGADHTILNKNGKTPYKYYIRKLRDMNHGPDLKIIDFFKRCDHDHVLDVKEPDVD